MGLSNIINKITGKVDNVLGYNKNITDPYDFSAKNSGGQFNFRSYFLSLFHNWEFAFPHGFMFIVYIDPYPSGLNSRDFIVYEGTDGAGLANNVKDDINVLTSDQYQRTDAGCMFVNGVSLPLEQMNTQHAELLPNFGRGFIPGVIGGPRQSFIPLVLEFRETNRSFVDSIVRPWTILTAHYGLVARPPSDPRNIKSNIMIIQLGKAGPGKNLINRKIHRYYDVAPIRTNTVNIAHDIDQIAPIATEWVYSKYNVETLADAPIDIVLNDINKNTTLSFLDKITGGRASKLNNKINKLGNAVQGVDRTFQRGSRALGGIFG